MSQASTKTYTAVAYQLPEANSLSSSSSVRRRAGSQTRSQFPGVGRRRKSFDSVSQIFSGSTVATFICASFLLGVLFYQAFALYLSPEPYSVLNSVDHIRQVMAKLDQDSFVKRLHSSEKYVLAQKVQFVSNIINRHQIFKGQEELAFSIVSASLKENIDPLLITAIVKSESTFKTGAISNKGARGLMQLMPDTARFTERNLQKAAWTRKNSNIHTTDYNLLLGITYLKHLENAFAGNRELALIAYNWGPGNLKNALKNRTHIPESTRAYARKILRNHEKWQDELRYLALNVSPSSSAENKEKTKEVV